MPTSLSSLSRSSSERRVHPGQCASPLQYRGLLYYSQCRGNNWPNPAGVSKGAHIVTSTRGPSNKRPKRGTFRHTYGNVTHSIGLRLSPPPSVSNLSSDRQCARGMLRQPCLNYSLTLWPRRYTDTSVQPDSVAWGFSFVYGFYMMMWASEI